MDAIKEMMNLKLDHSKGNFREAFGITDKKRDDFLFELVANKLENTKEISRVIEDIYNNDTLGLNERVYCLFRVGDLLGNQKGEVRAMKSLAKGMFKALDLDQD